ncbi:OX-2 membrane glycoprotein-like [Solea senegalensis]|uniref:OX-2 membrane glycoprotein-like n=1 Tax=Solea senegalensis TaxID=28829 RepID=A0AAV6RDT7_SOLSE|nr:OX-2 membrane glycoprotein-like [Solea senegalensis]
MCGPFLPLRHRHCLLLLLLWIIGAAVFTTHGEVITPASLAAEAGRPLVLGCNITMAPDDVVLQVRWQYGDKLLLAYQPGKPLRITHHNQSVQFTEPRDNASYITIKRVLPDDDGGCFRCIFDVYPSGTQEGRTCIRVTSSVWPTVNKTAISGKPVTFSCQYSVPERVEQVMWRKTAEQGDTTTMASYNKRDYYKIEEQFKGRVSLSKTLGETKLTIQSVRTEDEACYTCEFHAYPDGSKRANTCLSVYVLPKPEVNHVTSSPGVTEANCTAQSRPAADITWNLASDNRTIGPPISSAYDQGDGTTIVTSSILFHSELLSDTVKCIVHHQGLENPLTVFVTTNVPTAMVILLSVCGVAAVLLLCLCVCLCKHFVCTDGEYKNAAVPT